jgi:uncharacterized protein (TIGR00290 family)
MLALHRAISKGGKPTGLLTMLEEGGERSRGHGLSRELLALQSQSLGIPMSTYATTWDDYEATFKGALRTFKAEGIEDGVFGDIDLEGHREWVERVCIEEGVRAHLPLWKEKRRTLLDDLFHLGYRAVIVAIKTSVLDERFLGRVLDSDLVEEMEAAGLDASGEEGEYHTVVIDGPGFRFPLSLKTRGRASVEGVLVLDLEAKAQHSPWRADEPSRE